MSFVSTTLLWVMYFCVSQASAGLSASNVVVAVNAGSFNSRTVANHYVSLRKIPSANVIVLDDVPNSEVIGVEAFREKILKPLLKEIERRGLTSHVQCVAYSADFPTAINISQDLEPLEDLHFIFTKQASINALTYFYREALGGDPAYIDLEGNYYARRKLDAYFSNPAGAQSSEQWKQAQEMIDQGQHAAAADQLEELLKELPDQFPVAYLAAAQAAEAGQAERAVELLEAAISKGWTSAAYLREDGRFDAIRDNADFQILELSLDESVGPYQPATAFKARRAWAPNGVPVSDANLGRRYLLSTVLAVTRGGGLAVPEAIDYLQRAAEADFTRPEGVFYFCKTKDVRTRTRSPGFDYAISRLRQFGFEAEQVNSVLPRQKSSVLGLQCGTAKFNWSASGSKFAAGAIADNLTSTGGRMSSRGGQTKMTEFLAAGAAGSSGTVIEPYSLQQKFPHPQMFVHYASGASLAEAFYLSVTGPYQLLIVGDPLCRPFSVAPQQDISTALTSYSEGDSVRCQLDLSHPKYANLKNGIADFSNLERGLAPTAVVLLVDGQSPKPALARERLAVRLAGQAPGYHEIRLQMIADDPYLQASEVQLPIWIGDHESVVWKVSRSDKQARPAADADGGDGGTRSVSADGSQAVEPLVVSLRDEELRVEAAAPNAETVTLWNAAEQIGAVSKNEAEFTVPIASLGMGPVRLQVRATLPNGVEVAGQPIIVQVGP